VWIPVTLQLISHVADAIGFVRFRDLQIEGLAMVTLRDPWTAVRGSSAG
jgi:hypothetical protein